MAKIPIGMDVLTAAKERLKWTFDNFEKVYISFSGGKDSTVMLHLAMDEAIKRKRKVGLLFVDLEGQYTETVRHIQSCYDYYSDWIEPYWCCLPLNLRNAVSVYNPFWTCWDKEQEENWIRPMPKIAIKDESFFSFFSKGMEFEEFVPLFGEWYSGGKSCACLVGIRTDESLNRFRTIASKVKTTKDGKQYTTKVTENVFNSYPIYDWKTSDLWLWHSKNKEKPHNKIYDIMHKAGLTPDMMRICQPYGDDQRRGLWLFHLMEPYTWSKVVARVNGANSGALYVQESGNINGYHKITKPDNHTWKSFSEMFMGSLPPKTAEHYRNKIAVFCKWHEERGYPEGIPDEADYRLEAERVVPSWRRICKTLLRNDFWCKGLGFSQHKSKAYQNYLNLMKRRKEEEKWKVQSFNF